MKNGSVKYRGHNVSLEKQLSDGSYRGRVRNSNGSSVRGLAKQNKNGVWRFYPTNPSLLD